MNTKFKDTALESLKTAILDKQVIIGSSDRGVNFTCGVPNLITHGEQSSTFTKIVIQLGDISSDAGTEKSIINLYTKWLLLLRPSMNSPVNVVLTSVSKFGPIKR